MLNPIQSFDERRDIAIPGDEKATIYFAAEHWVQTAEEAIAKRSRFCVALSGGSTPNAIYQTLSKVPFANRLDWSRVHFFWSDERAVPPNHPESNYHNAMISGLSRLPLAPFQIIRMEAEGKDLDMKAKEYEGVLRSSLGPHLFDLVMLGIGEDGHTASLFPHTAALQTKGRYVVANYVPEKKSWRLTLTFEAIEQSRLTVLYALGASKSAIVNQVLSAKSPSPYPASRIGSKTHKALWIIDKSAATDLFKNFSNKL